MVNFDYKNYHWCERQMERRCTGIQNALELGDLKDKHVEQKT